MEYKELTEKKDFSYSHHQQKPRPILHWRGGYCHDHDLRRLQLALKEQSDYRREAQHRLALELARGRWRGYLRGPLFVLLFFGVRVKSKQKRSKKAKQK